MLLIEHILSLKPVTGSTVATIMLVAIACAVRGTHGSRWISAALLTSLAFALYATVYGTHLHFVAGCTISFFVVLTGESKECKAIAALYVLRLLLPAMVELKVIDMVTMWSANMLLLWLQLIVACASILPERGRRKIYSLATRSK